jgi:hypothetical protein
MKLAHYGLMVLLAAPLACATAGQASPQAAQEQDPLAAAARRAREKQKEQPKPAKVWDNDNIPSSGQVSVVGNSTQSAPAAPSKTAAPETAGQNEKTGAESSKKKADLEAQLKSAKDDLKNLQTSLDFAQRKLALDQQSYYQKPDYASDTGGARALKDEQSQIDAKKQQVDAAQKKVDDLQEQVQAAGGAKDSTGSANSADSGNSGSTGNSSSTGNSDQGSAH